MGEIVNLKQVRKQKARAEAAKKAEQNRIVFGRTKHEKTRTRSEQEKLKKSVDSHKLDDKS